MIFPSTLNVGNLLHKPKINTKVAWFTTLFEHQGMFKTLKTACSALLYKTRMNTQVQRSLALQP